MEMGTEMKDTLMMIKMAEMKDTWMMIKTKIPMVFEN